MTCLFCEQSSQQDPPTVDPSPKKAPLCASKVALPHANGILNKILKVKDWRLGCRKNLFLKREPS